MANGTYYYNGNSRRTLLGKHWEKGDQLPDEVGSLRQLRALESQGVVVFIPSAPGRKDAVVSPARSIRSTQAAVAAAATPPAPAAPVKKTAAKKAAAKPADTSSALAEAVEHG